MKKEWVKMSSDKEEFYTAYQSLKQVNFSFKSLRALFSLGPRVTTWDDTIELLATISNLSLGRQYTPGLVDAIIAERRREAIDGYMFRIVDNVAEDCVLPERGVCIECLHSTRGVFGSFRVNIATRYPKEDWFIAGIQPSFNKVFMIVDTVKSAQPRCAGDDRFINYTVFDNINSYVEINEIGTDYLNALSGQIYEYAGTSMQELYQSFLKYADLLLCLHADYKLQVNYRMVAPAQCQLEVKIYTEDHGHHQTIASFKEVLAKKRY